MCDIVSQIAGTNDVYKTFPFSPFLAAKPQSTVVSPIGDPTVRRPLGIDQDRLFYLQSRGIGYAGAVRLLLHEASVPGVAWADLGAGGPA